VALKVIKATDEFRDRWNNFADSRSDAALYHDYRWRDVIRRAFGRETCYMAAVGASDEIRAILPLARLKSLVFGDFLVSLPYFNYGGSLADSDAARETLLSAAAEYASGLGVDHIEFRHEADVWPRLSKRLDKVAMVLRLPDDTDALSKRLGTKLRAQIRRPIKEGASVTIGGSEHVEAFYAVFSRNMRDLGTPVYPKRFFVEIASTFAKETRIFIVSVAGEPVAAGFVLRHRNRVEIPWAASLRESNRIGVNMLLYFSVLEWCVQQGVRTFDFGRSTIDSGTYRFKAQWGAEPIQLYWHYWLPDQRDLPQIRPDNPKYRLLVNIWRRQPVALANLIGPHIAKNLP
jgi:serine/alanine adding enzyme